MALSIQRTSVYIKNDFAWEEKPKAPEKIAGIWAQFKLLIEANADIKDLKPIMADLGVAETDALAHEMLLPMMKMALGNGVEIAHSDAEEALGIYYLSKDGEKFAVFKVGEKRAGTELLVRHIAHVAGLEKHTVPGVFCSISCPEFPEEEPMSAELWNGDMKLFTVGKRYNAQKYMANLKAPWTLTGILEPLVPPNSQEITEDDLGRMTVLAIILGLRDAKLDGIVGDMFVDVEDCMPCRFLLGKDLSPSTSVASLHLPYLEHPAAKKPISQKTLAELFGVINKFDLIEFMGALSKLEVKFADLSAENKQKRDHGNCPIQNEEMPKVMEDHPTVDFNKTLRILADQQLLAFGDRVTRLKSTLTAYLEMNVLPTPLDIVCQVDPMFHAHLKALDKARYGCPLNVVGRHSPKTTRVLILEDDRAEIRSASDSPHSPSPWIGDRKSWSFLSEDGLPNFTATLQK